MPPVQPDSSVPDTLCVSEHNLTEHALRTRNEHFETMFMQAPLGIALIDSLTGQIHEVNPRFAEIAGRPMAAMASIDWLQITHPDDVQADLDNMALLNAGKISGFQMEKRYLHPDGTAVWIDMTIAPLKVEDSVHPRHLCMIQDITERKAAESTIAHLNRVYAMLSGINTLIVRVRDRDELFRKACQIAVKAGGFRMAMICIVDRRTMLVVPMATTGKNGVLLADIKRILSSPEDAPKTMVARAIREKKAVVSNDSQSDARVLFGKQYAKSGVRSQAVLPLIVADEVVGVLALYASEIDFFQADELKLLSELASDIAFAIDHIGKREQLNYLAYYDALTGLANRTLFLERVAQYMRSAVSGGHTLALLLLDVERFKNINDSLGWPTGDALLKQVAGWLTQSTGDANLLARIDADHFALVMPEVSQVGDLARLVEKTMETFLEHPFRLNDAVFRIAAKVGVALFPDDATDADTLFCNAEAALKCQDQRRSLPVSHQENDRRGGQQADPGNTAAPSARQRRIHAPLPTQDQPCKRQTDQCRGADPLERPAYRPGAAGSIHPDSGRNRPDLRGRALGAAQGHRGLSALAQRRAECRAHRGQCLATATAQSRFHRRNRAAHRHRRTCRDGTGTGNHRKPDHGRRDP